LAVRESVPWTSLVGGSKPRLFTRVPRGSRTRASVGKKPPRAGTLGNDHELTFTLHILLVKSIYLRHFLGGDRYRDSYDYAIAELEGLKNNARRLFGEESKQAKIVAEMTADALNHRLE